MKSRLQTWSKHCRLHVHQPFTHSLFGGVPKKKIFFFLQNCQTFYNCFLLTRQGTCLEMYGACETPFFIIKILMFDSGRVGGNLVITWFWTTTPPRRKLSILDHGRVLARLNDSVRNCCKMININFIFENYE